MIFHASLMKRYITRNTASTETSPGDGSVPAASLAVVEDDDNGSSCNDCGCIVLSELGGSGRKESVKDLKFGDDFSAEQQHELKSWHDVSIPFSTTALIRLYLRSIALRSPYTSPSVVVKKKDGFKCVGIEYRRLNKLTLFDPFP
ncbi:Zinc finger protein [Plakobranchus ocellatus]|uniref:Zinc finger protein n=1 Tax=Plakobranchus ocellatus TaxID=259542 RepID=A0AAV4DDL9_9GAST|nr:Zinc finger protein [Plakobranchus ocellatus]